MKRILRDRICIFSMMKMNFLIVLLVMCRAVKMAPNLLEFRNAGSLGNFQYRKF